MTKQENIEEKSESTFVNAVEEAIRDHALDMTIAQFCGCLEMLKFDLINGAWDEEFEDDSDE